MTLLASVQVGDGCKKETKSDLKSDSSKASLESVQLTG